MGAAALVIATGCGGTRTASATVSTASSPLPATASAPATTDEPGGSAASALPAFTCTELPGSGGSRSAISAVRAAAHDGYDRIVFEFSGPVPGYQILRQATPDFIQDPSGRTSVLGGSAGLRVRLEPASAHPTYQGAAHLALNLPVVREGQQLGDFEAVATWGFGVSRSTCVRAFTITSPSRLVIDVQH